jgi:DNA replication protein DnaC
MANSEIRVRDRILEVGTSLYGNEFNLNDEIDLDVYRKCFQVLWDLHHKKGKKGVLLIGSYGVGKSAMMRILQRLFTDSEARFKWVSAYELRDMSESLTLSEIKEYYGYEYKGDLYVDDIGIALDVKRFGNTVNVISEIILERYDLFVESGFRTHFSSNLATKVTDPKVATLETMYGKRVLDRMFEMCKIVVHPGKESKRK